MQTIRPVARVMVLPILLLFALAGCAVTQDEEVQMGRQVAPQFEEEFGGLYPDPQVQEYVDRVGMRIVQEAGRQDLPWKFQVLDSEQINAFALPGGLIYITEGLLFSLENEAQLAAILAHEAGHVTHRHSVEQLERAQIIQGGAALAGLATESGAVGDISQIVGGLVLMRYSRDQERDADLSGLEYLLAAGYDPNAMIQALEIIHGESGDGGPPEFLSTHPDPENRLEYLQEAIDTRYGNVISAGRTNQREFQRNIVQQRR